MAVETQLLELPFASGVDQKVDSRWLTIGNQTSLTNGAFVKAGAINKRWGYTALGLTAVGGGTPFGFTAGSARAKKVGGLGDHLWQAAAYAVGGSAGGSQRLFSYIGGISTWQQIDELPDCNAYHKGIAEWPTSTNTYDAAFGNGYLISTYTAYPYSSATIYQTYVSVQEWSTGTYVFKNYAVDTPGANNSVSRVIVVPKTVASVTTYYAIVVWYDQTATTDIYARALNLTTMAWASATKVIANYDAASERRNWDICTVAGVDDAWAIVFARNDAGTKTTKVIQFTTLFATTASATYGPPPAYTSPGHGYAICGNASKIWTAVAYDDTTNTQIFVKALVTNTLANFLSETSLGVAYTGTANGIRLAGCVLDNTDSLWITSNRDATVGARWRSISSAGTLGTVRRMLNHDVASKPLQIQPDGDQSFQVAWLAYNGNLVGYTGSALSQIVQTAPQGTYRLVHLHHGGELYDGTTSSATSIGRPIATIAPRIANTVSSTWSNTVCTAFTAIDTQTFVAPGTVVSSSSTRFALRAMVAEFKGDRFSGVQLGESFYFAGGVPSVYDGQNVTEIGFLHPPPATLSLAASNGAGSLTSLGVYTYYVLYQYVTAKGEIVRSAASIGSVTLGAADDTVTITLNACTCTTKQDAENGFNPPITFQVYRNIAGGATFYQIIADNAAPANDPGTYSQTFIDLVSDSAVVTLSGAPAPIWPFSSGALEPYCPPALQKLVAYNGRLFGIGDDLRSIWYTTALTAGEQPRFNDNFVIAVDDDITGLEIMDGSLFIFSATGILRLSGNGPTEEGSGNDLGAPDIVPTDVGCIESRSLLATNQGIFFQASPGIYLLTRGGEPMFIGQAVTDTLASYPIVVATTLVALHNEVRFECRATETDGAAGVTLVYNYNFKAWSVFDRYDTERPLATAAATSSTVVDDVYYWTTDRGQVYSENAIETATNAFTDNGRWVTLTLESAWAHPSSILGYAKFKQINVLGVNNDPHNLVVSSAIDYSSTYSFSQTFTADEMATWSTALQMAEFQVADQRAVALRVKLNDATPTGLAATTGRGPTLVGLQLEVGGLRGPYRLPPAQGA